MSIGQDRNYWASHRKPPGIYRIMCLGDSMTYGQGVAVDQTVPAQLELNLNKAVWNHQVEVLNQGISGGAIYDVWANYLSHGKYFDPDLLVLILCDNDAQFFPSPKGKYKEHVRLNWSKDGPYYDYFVMMLQNISSYVKKHNLPLVLAFYFIYPQDFREIVENIRDILGTACLEMDIDFIDLSMVFEREHDGSFNESMMVSPGDGHPSALAHSFAAGALARHILQNHTAGLQKEEKKSEPVLIQSLFNNANEMIRLGYDPTYTLDLLPILMNVKHRSSNRLSLESNQLIDTDVYESNKSRVQALRRQYIEALYLKGYLRRIDEICPDFLQRCNEIHNKLRLLYKNVFPICRNLLHPALRYFPYKDKEIEPGNVGSNLEKLEETSKSLECLLSTLEKSRHTIKDKFNDTPVSCLLQLNVEELRRPLLRELHLRWLEAEAISSRFLEISDEFVRAVRQVKYKELSSIQTKDIEGASRDFFDIYSKIVKIFNVLHLEKIEFSKKSDQMESFVHINVTVSCKCEGLSLMSVKVKPLIPRYKMIHAQDWMIRDGQFHLYKHKLPFFTLGSISFSIKDYWNTHQDSFSFSIKEIEIYINPNNRLKFKDIQLKQLTQGMFIFSVQQLLIPM